MMAWTQGTHSDITFNTTTLTAADTHLVELQQQRGAGPAGVVEGQQEDAEQPGGAADQGRDHAPQALLRVMHHAVGGPV